MTSIDQLSDEEIDALLLHLFNHSGVPLKHNVAQRQQRIEDFSDQELMRIRSKNHPDKWPNVNQAAYQAAIEELDRRRQKKSL
jgi:hypothetical protein